MVSLVENGMLSTAEVISKLADLERLVQAAATADDLREPLIALISIIRQDAEREIPTWA